MTTDIQLIDSLDIGFWSVILFVVLFINRLAVGTLCFKAFCSIRLLFTNLFIYFLWNFVYYYSYLDTSNKSLKIIGCYYYTDSETTPNNRFSISDVSLPIRLNNSYNTQTVKVEIVYEHFNKVYRFIEKDMTKNVSSFAYYTNEQLNSPIGNSSGMLSAVLVDSDERTDITNLIIEYQGPMRNFYNDIPGYVMTLSDINHPQITVNTILEILDMNFDTKIFSYNDLIVLGSE